MNLRKLFPAKEYLKPAINMAWPAIFESFFMALTGLVDSYMVSSLGKNAVAAVGLTTQPKFMGLALFFAMSVSVSALVARRVGEQKREDGNRVALTGFCFVVIAAIIISTVLVSAASPIIRFCGSSENTHDMAVSYFRIIMGGMIFNCLQIVINASQRGSGNTKITMRTNMTSNAVNVVMNYVLIGGHLGFPALGIQGAAIATVLGTVVACVMSFLSVRSEKTFISIPYIFRNKIKPSLKTFGNIIKVGYSVFFEQVLIRVGFMLTAIMAAKQGDGAMAAHQVGMNVLGLSFSFGDGLQAAAVALIGRSLGEGSPEKAKAYGSTCRFMGLCISIVLAVGFFFGGRPLYTLFFKEPEIVDTGAALMREVIIICIFQISAVIYMGCLRGAGDTAYTAAASTFSVTVVRSVVSYIGCYILGFEIIGIWFGIIADQMSRFILASIRFRRGKWVNIRI